MLCRLTPVVLRELSHLIVKKKPEEEDELADLMASDTLKDSDALADPEVRLLKRGDKIQLERM